MSTPNVSINIGESDVVSSTPTGFAIVEGTARGRRKVIVEVKLDQASTEVVTVDYATADITATSDLFDSPDYRARKGTFTFQPGETKKTFKLEIQQGRRPEDDETLSITLSNPTNANIPSLPTIVTILDDDTRKFSVNIKESDVTKKTADGFSIIEGTFRGRRIVNVEVSLDKASSQTVSVDYNTADITTTVFQDYRERKGTFTFKPGEVKKTFKLEVQAGRMAEADEQLSINLSNAKGAALPVAPTIITILNDDGPVPGSIDTAAFKLADTSSADFAGITSSQSVALVQNSSVSDVIDPSMVAIAA